jgi:hypothetical protein
VGLSGDEEEGQAAGGLWGSSDPLSEDPGKALDTELLRQVRGRFL